MTLKEFKEVKKRNINQYKTAQKKVFRFVTKELGYSRHGLRFNKALDIFKDYLGIEIEEHKQEWILEEYFKQKLEIFKPLNIKFYLSPAWKILRTRILNKYGKICMRCGNTENIHVDHILPRSLHPELELVEDNMQVLCMSCNCSKSNRHTIDYRENTIYLQYGKN